MLRLIQEIIEDKVDNNDEQDFFIQTHPFSQSAYIKALTANLSFKLDDDDDDDDEEEEEDKSTPPEKIG